MALVAEITHRCPLQCPYCSNPRDMAQAGEELSTADWQRVFAEAAALGVLHLHLSGGEPMARRDLPALVRTAAAAGLYTNLITSGVLLDERRLAALAAAGLDHVQLSFQHADTAEAERIGGMAGAQAKKIAAARLVVAAGLPLTCNFVIHRQNARDVAAMIALAAELGAGRVEIAHTQYHGWGLVNRDALLPDAAEVEAATAAVEAARAVHRGRMAIDYVTPDYHADRPKACMGGWAQRFIVVTPSGRALPCHAAETIPGLSFPDVRGLGLAEIWGGDPAFLRFRGTGWMPEPCRSCAFKAEDWGGCRCQALALTGDASATDPVCDRSPLHGALPALIAARAAIPPAFVYRRPVRQS
ncbi:MAG: pyrroloquinoline quinone biosynthesis protein PqqE [Proteobacteria bacterium]|nr:pyrroloquinoline quinone biosynthesis protein PqqE [Pseudomonadota bacterium]